MLMSQQKNNSITVTQPVRTSREKHGEEQALQAEMVRGGGGRPAVGLFTLTIWLFSRCLAGHGGEDRKAERGGDGWTM